MRIALLAFLVLAAGCTKKEAPSTTTTPSSASAASAAEQPPFKELSVEELDKRLASKDGKTFVFDANPRAVFDKNHVPGAVYVPDEGVTASLLPGDKSAALIFYCANPH